MRDFIFVLAGFGMVEGICVWVCVCVCVCINKLYVDASSSTSVRYIVIVVGWLLLLLHTPHTIHYSDI